MNRTALPLLTPGPARQHSLALVFLAGAIIGVLGGMIGLGGAEFRLPLLIGIFGFAALQAIIMNKAMSLIVVITALPARLFAVPLADLSPHWFIVLNLLAGSLIGAWLGAHWATRLKSKTLYRVIAVLLVLIAVLLFVTHFFAVDPLNIPADPRTVLGIAAGVIIGVVAALMGVAGGELLIPTIVLLYGTDIKIAGSLSLAVSLPTMLVAFARFSKDKSFTVLRQNKPFLVQAIPRYHDAGLHDGDRDRRPAAGRCFEPGPDSLARPAPAAVIDQSLESRLTALPVTANPAANRTAGPRFPRADRHGPLRPLPAPDRPDRTPAAARLTPTRLK